MPDARSDREPVCRPSALGAFGAPSACAGPPVTGLSKRPCYYPDATCRGGHLAFSPVRCALMSESPNHTARRARYCIYVLGGACVALGFSLEMVPSLADVCPPLAGRICAGIGAVVMAVGRFGSDRFLRRCEMLLTGWL
jgi:hypothetical protein